MFKYFENLKNTTAYKNLICDTRDKNFVTAFGVQPNEKPFVAALFEESILYVCSDYVESQRVFREIQSLACGKAFYMPHKDDVLLYKRNSSKSTIYERNFVLNKLLHENVAVVCCIEALMQFLPKQEKFLQDCFVLQKGVCYDTGMLLQKLVSCGYKRTDCISAEGEFTLRGDILDVYVPLDKRYRIDFFDDEIEKIMIVSDDSTVEIEKFEVYPLYDTTGLRSKEIDKIQKIAQRSKISSDAQSRLSEILSEICLSATDGIVDNNWLVPFVENDTIANYLPQNTIIIWDEPKLLKNRVNFLEKEHSQRVLNLTKAGEVLPIHYNSLVESDKIFSLSFRQLSLQTLPYKETGFEPYAIYNLKTGAVPNYAVSEETLAMDIKNWKQTGYEVSLFVSRDDVNQILEKMSRLGVYLSEDAKKTSDGVIFPTALERGFVSHTNKLVVIGSRDLGRGVKRGIVSKNKRQAFLSVEKGDYVVHEVHGIGLCEGIKKLKIGECEKDYVVVLYKNGDRLYVPVDATNLLSRYSGGDNPSLSKLGGDDFSKVKEKVRGGIKAMSIDLLKLYAEREKARGFKYHIDDYLDEEFGQYFPYRLTEDQIKCQNEIKADLTSEKIMDRVLVGDVGYGKTEVAMRAAFDVVSNGYQVAILAPTTILAEQHYNSFKERMSHFDIKVECLNRFRSAEQQKIILQNVKQGKVDILIGTHRLLSKDVSFDKLGLLILDEEQRFGVEHKETIKNIKHNVDVLTLSATPIPRTLHMALSGIRDISTITTPPVDRMAVETFVAEENEALIADVITRELSRGGQVFVVYNRVQSIESFANKVATLVPQAQIIVAHGQMSEVELEDAVLSFAGGKGNVLVCTTIIENGIDIPNANTIIVVDADKFGLSQLYQLRGRVGRSNRLAYAYFLYKQDKVLNEVAYKRLASITEYSELGSGFKIAMKDLEIRGAGNILGREQHGHMVKVGYDMYARMLKETVDELKGKEVQQKFYTEVEVDIEAYAPESYIPNQTDRMDFYQQLAACNEIEEIQKLQKQINDVYGANPTTVSNLFVVARLKLLANKAGISKVVVRVGKGELTFATKEKMMRKEVFDALSADERIQPLSGSYGVQFVAYDFLQKDRLLNAMFDFLNSVVGGDATTKQ